MFLPSVYGTDYSVKNLFEKNPQLKAALNAKTDKTRIEEILYNIETNDFFRTYRYDIYIMRYFISIIDAIE